MIGMLQILTYLLSFYLVIKGIEILQIALSSGRESRKLILTIGVITLAACVIAATSFSVFQDEQASHIGAQFPRP